MENTAYIEIKNEALNLMKRVSEMHPLRIVSALKSAERITEYAKNNDLFDLSEETAQMDSELWEMFKFQLEAVVMLGYKSDRMLANAWCSYYYKNVHNDVDKVIYFIFAEALLWAMCDYHIKSFRKYIAQYIPDDIQDKMKEKKIWK